MLSLAYAGHYSRILVPPCPRRKTAFEEAASREHYITRNAAINFFQPLEALKVDGISWRTLIESQALLMSR
jgi:hypothetical protein